MNERMQTPIKQYAAAVLLASLSVGLTLGSAHAESLFRAGIAYQTSQPYTPRSLFAVPRPASVGDSVTISIDELTSTSVQSNTTLSKKQSIDEESIGVVNNIIRRVVGVPELFPRLNGMENEQKTGITASTAKSYAFKDSITCQVVQVLPNGHLVVQGRKTVMANTEQQDLLVSGIVNPYYLDAQNTITSKQVANLQMHIGGRGLITRQQGDGVLGKYFQFFN